MSVDEQFSIEEQLRDSLRHVPAPEGFTDRVMSRIGDTGGRRAKVLSMRSSTFGNVAPYGSLWAGIAAALLVAAGGGGMYVHQQRQAREAAAVQAQIDMAMQLTSHALNEVQIGLHRSPAGRFEQLWNGTEK